MLNWRRSWNLVVLVALLVGVLPLAAMAQPAAQPDWSKVDPVLLETMEAEGPAGFYIILTVQADLSGAAALPTKEQKTAYVFDLVTQVAKATQPPLLDYLRSQGTSSESMYIQNMIRVDEAGMGVVEWMAARPDVAQIVSLPDPQLDPIYEGKAPEERRAIEWNIIRVKAPDVWAMGVTGEGAVVASNDTGVDYTHEALVDHYRGNLGGGNFDHNYNWWDAWGGSPSPVPVDYDGHGTHTTGTMAGDDGADNQIGVAPGATWVACAGLNLECLEFFLAPWDLDGLNPDPAMAPDAINNSWYDPSGFDYRPIIQTLNAAGVAVIKSAGNGGPGCSTVTNPGYVPEIIATAAFDSSDTIASFSSRGPTDNYGETILKPEVAAPGVNVRSSTPGDNYSYYSGTSMAAPHTTALVGLIWSAAPCLEGDVPATKQIMMDTAEAMIDDQCPPFVDHPNDVWGWGVLDDLAAVQAAIEFCGALGTLEGTVTDDDTGAFLEGVKVLAEAPGGYYKAAYTDASGFYSMDVPADIYTVGGSVYGYEPVFFTDIVVETDLTTVGPRRPCTWLRLTR
jgi:subtilisin family serine protease